jgi:hypothetical protein
MMRKMLSALLCLALPLSATAGEARAFKNPYVAYQARDWVTCARLYAAQADRDPPVGGAAYDAACCLALAGDREGAFARLLATPTSQLRRHIAEDPDLVSLHGDPRWIRLIEHFHRDEAERAATMDTALRTELLRRMSLDQELRGKYLQDTENQALGAQLTEVDRDNTRWLKETLKARGWPGYTLVGRDGSMAAWLLAQHADLEPAFQEEVLAILGSAVERGEASGAHLAYLTDRVRLAQGKTQVYGTQFHTVDGKAVPLPLENPEQVDERRRAVGLITLEEYSEQMNSRSPSTQ